MTKRLLIDSQCRHSDESSDNYTVDFSGLMKAKKIALVASHVDFTAQLFSDGCDSLSITSFTAGGIEQVSHHLSLEHGSPEAGASAAALGTFVVGRLNASFAALGLPDFNAVMKDGRLRITSNARFGIRSGPSVARILGFRTPASGRDEATGVQSRVEGAQHVLDMPFKPEQATEPYLLLHLSIAGGLDVPVNASDGAVAVILPGKIDVAQPFYCSANPTEFERMTVKLLRLDGSRYDFNGGDHRLEFLIETK